MPSHSKPNRQNQRTNRLVFSAFSHLMQSKSYDEIRVVDIVQQANIGKSTYYDHFKDKDDLLLKSLVAPLNVMARGLLGYSSHAELESTLDHIWEKRSWARVGLRREIRHIFEKNLQNRLMQLVADNDCEQEGIDLCFMSAGLLSVLNQWVNGRLSLSSAQLALWIVSSNSDQPKLNQKGQPK